MSQLFLASTFFGALNLVAAIDDGVFDSPDPQRRVLLVATNSAVPEATTPANEMEAFDSIRDRFDDVVDLNALFAPYRPQDFDNFGEPTVVAPWFRSHLRLDDSPVELILESIQVKPARTLADLFVAARITVYSDGLMSYGPTRVALPWSLGSRIDRLVYLDLVPGVRPLLLSEFGVELVPIGAGAFRSTIQTVTAASSLPGELGASLAREGATALVLGQYLGSLGILDDDEERRMYADIAVALDRLGHRTIAFKPHPTAPNSLASVREVAHELGVTIVELPQGLVVEQLLDVWQPELIAGCFSTGLIVARGIFGVPAASMGADLVLRRLQPFENSNRIPLTIVDASVPRLSLASGVLPAPIDDPEELQMLVDMVGFAMQPRRRPSARPRFDDAVAAFPEALLRRYLPTPRALRLGVPGTPMRRRRALKFRLIEIAESSVRIVERSPRVLAGLRRLRLRVWPTIDRQYRRSPRLRRVGRILLK